MQRGVDEDSRAQEDAGSVAVEAALQLASAGQHVVGLARLSGLVIAHARLRSALGQVQPVDEAGDVEPGARDLDRQAMVPRHRDPVPFRRLPAERNLHPAGLAGIGRVRVGQRVQRDPAHLVQGPSPDECGGDRLLALPDGRDRRDGCSHGHPSAVRGRRREAGSGLQVGDGGFEDFVHEAAERPVVEREGLLARIRGFEAEPVPPDEAERVTEQLAQRTSGVDAPEHGEHDRMVRAYASVVGRETGAGPRIPAACGGRRLSGRPELLRPCHQAVDLADGVVGDAVPAEMGFVGMIAQERALPEQAAIGAAPRAREDDRLGAGRENGGEVARSETERGIGSRMRDGTR